MPTVYRVKEAASILGVSDDTLRRWIDTGRIAVEHLDSGPAVIGGVELARVAEVIGAGSVRPESRPIVGESARNRFAGVVVRVVRDKVMAQVEIQSGPHRIVSLMSRESADQLHLEPGVRAVAAIKSTNVVVEVPQQ